MTKGPTQRTALTVGAVVRRGIGGMIWAVAGAAAAFVGLGLAVAAGVSVSDAWGSIFVAVGAALGAPVGVILFASLAIRQAALHGAKRVGRAGGIGALILLALFVARFTATGERITQDMTPVRELFLVVFVTTGVLLLGAVAGAWVGSLRGWLQGQAPNK